MDTLSIQVPGFKNSFDVKVNCLFVYTAHNLASGFTFGSLMAQLVQNQNLSFTFFCLDTNLASLLGPFTLTQRSSQVVTWNVATMFPGEDANLASLLGDHKGKPDILMLALQEVKSQPQNLLAGKNRETHKQREPVMRILIGSSFQITWWQGRTHGPRACGAALHLSVMSRCAPLCIFT